MGNTKYKLCISRVEQTTRPISILAVLVAFVEIIINHQNCPGRTNM